MSEIERIKEIVEECIRYWDDKARGNATSANMVSLEFDFDMSEGNSKTKEFREAAENYRTAVEVSSALGGIRQEMMNSLNKIRLEAENESD